MNVWRVIPLTSLGIVATVLIVGSLYDPALETAPFQAPEGAEIPAPELGLGGESFFGRVVDSDGNAISDAGVTTEQGGRPIWTWTAPDGRFALEELLPGRIQLRVVALGFQATVFDEEIAPGPAAPDPAAPVEFTLDRPIGPPPTPPRLVIADLKGSVDFGPAWEPRGATRSPEDQRYEIYLEPLTAPVDAAGGFPRRAPVRSDGTFEIELLHQGEYRVILLSPENRGAREPDLLAGADGTVFTFTHEVGGDTPDLAVTATLGSVRGRVLEGVGGKPIRGALIRVERLVATTREDGAEPPQPPGAEAEATPDRVTFQATQSDKDGWFFVGDLAPGRYVVHFVAGKIRQSQEITVSERATTSTWFEVSSTND